MGSKKQLFGGMYPLPYKSMNRRYNNWHQNVSEMAQILSDSDKRAKLLKAFWRKLTWKSTDNPMAA